MWLISKQHEYFAWIMLMRLVLKFVIAGMFVQELFPIQSDYSKNCFHGHSVVKRAKI